MSDDQLSYSARFLGLIFGTEALHRFRDDFRLIIETTDRFQKWDDDIPSLRRQIAAGRETAKNSRIHLYADAIGLLGIAITFFPNSSFEIWIALASLFFFILGRVQTGVVDILVYNDPFDERRITRLKFMSAWNRGAMGSWKCYLILICGPLIRLNFIGYLMALLIVDNKYNK